MSMYGEKEDRIGRYLLQPVYRHVQMATYLQK